VDAPTAPARDPSRSLQGCRRIIVIGTTGSGKTTLATQLARHLDAPRIELDALHWGPNWTPFPVEVFRAQADAATTADRWVLDGNYSAVRDIVWPRADTLIWLDYAMGVNLWRLTRRGFMRSARRETLWHDNRETFRNNFFSRDSLFLWLLKSHGRNRRNFPALLARPEHAHLAVLRLRTPQATRRWLDRTVGG
jgi:pantothenate kinase-related protein Tda10